jgi:hypothetical protein
VELEFLNAKAEIDRISKRFAEHNPKYRLFVNTEIRSLEKQIERWQQVKSIELTGSQLRQAALKFLSQADRNLKAIPDKESLRHFVGFLTGWRASPPPTLAAPGLSLHGRGRAFDFQVRDATGRTVAGTDSSTIKSAWDASGWTAKLSKAVHGASDRFVGPLEAPREPWHYQYVPRQ